MAIEAERLLATFEARFASLEKALSKARGDATRAFGDIEAAGTRAENSLASIGARGTPGLSRYTQVARGAKVETGNLAAQINDIGVQLAGGQSPFLIAIQQGTQINQALGSTGARGAVAALGGAFMSLLNPVSLATIAIIGLGGVAAQYFFELISSGAKSAETLKQEAELVQRVADRWGEALPALREYVEARQRLADEAQKEKAVQIAIAGNYQKSADQVDRLSTEIVGLLDLLTFVEGAASGVGVLQDAFDELARKVADQTASAEDAKAVQQALMALFVQTGVPLTAELASEFDVLAGSLMRATEATSALRKEQALLGGPIGGEKIAGDKGSRGRRLLSEDEEVNLATRTNPSLFAQDRSTGGRTRRPATPFDDSAESATERTDALREEIELMRLYGASAEELAFQLDKARLARELMNAAEQQGLTITPELREKIDEIATAYAVAAQEKKKLAETQDGIKKSLEEINEFGKDILGGLISDLRNGVSAAEALQNALDRVLDKLIELALNALFSKIGLGSLFGPSVPGRAGGGPVQRGKPYVVGERRKELFVPNQSGRMLSAVPSSAASSQPRQTSPRLVFQVNDYAGEPMSATQQRQSNGDVLVKMIIGEVKKDYAKGGFNKLNASLYGQTPQKRRKG